MEKEFRPVRNNQGFTLLEVLLVVLLLAILAAIGITSFVGTTDTKNAATKEDLAILRKGVAAEMAIAQLDCGATGVYTSTYPDAWPTVNCLNSNSILVANSAGCEIGNTNCTATEVPGFNDQRFTTGAIPVNPWGTKQAGVGNVVYDCTAGGGTGAATGTGATGSCESVANGNASTTVECSGGAWGNSSSNEDGWCYDPTSGAIWANTNNNGGGNTGTAYENTY